MKKLMKIWYDKEGDFLEVKFGKTTGVVRPLGKECFELLDAKSKVVGYAIFNFTKRFKRTPEMVLPMKVEL